MTFTPFDNCIEVKPLENKQIILPEVGQKNFVEAGEVINKGKDVDFFAIGDIAHFDNWGCSKTTDAIDGIEHYIVQVNPQVIRGKSAK